VTPNVADVFRANRVEFIAIPVLVVLLGVLFVVFAVASIGVWAWIITGVVIVTAIVLVALRVARRAAHPPAADAPRPPEHRPAGAYRILVVVDANVAPPSIRARVAAHAPCDVLVVAPAEGSRIDRLTGDEAGYAKASGHLDEVLAQLGSVSGVNARGKVGSHDPLQAIDESLREFPADEIVFALSPDEGLAEVAESRYGIAVARLEASSAERV